MASLRVAIADDSLLVREGLRQLLSGVPDELEVVAVCEDSYALLEAIERDSPEVVLTDIRMPPFRDREGIRVAAQLRETHPEIGVVILSQYADPALALELFESRVRGAGVSAQGAGRGPRASWSRRSRRSPSVDRWSTRRSSTD